MTLAPVELQKKEFSSKYYILEMCKCTFQSNLSDDGVWEEILEDRSQFKKKKIPALSRYNKNLQRYNKWW